MLFNGNGVAFDQNDENVTSTLLDIYIGTYNSGDYNTIHDEFVELGIARIETYQESEISNPLSRVLMKQSYTNTVSVLITHNGSIHNGKTWYVIFTADGTYEYNDSTFQITAASTPKITVTYSGLGALFGASTDSMSCSAPVIESGMRSFTFTAKVWYTVSYEIPGIDYQVFDLGSYYSAHSFLISNR